MASFRSFTFSIALLSITIVSCSNTYDAEIAEIGHTFAVTNTYQACDLVPFLYPFTPEALAVPFYDGILRNQVTDLKDTRFASNSDLFYSPVERDLYFTGPAQFF